LIFISDDLYLRNYELIRIIKSQRKIIKDHLEVLKVYETYLITEPEHDHLTTTTDPSQVYLEFYRRIFTKYRALFDRNIKAFTPPNLY
jgi:hypothetical protein